MDLQELVTQLERILRIVITIVAAYLVYVARVRRRAPADTAR